MAQTKRRGKWVAGKTLIYHGRKLPSDYRTRIARARVEDALRPEGEGQDDDFGTPRLPQKYSIAFKERDFVEFHVGEKLVARWRDEDMPHLMSWLIEHLKLLYASLDLSKLYLQSVRDGKNAGAKRGRDVSAKAEARKLAISALRKKIDPNGTSTKEEIASTIAERNPTLGTKGSILKVL